MYMSARIIVTGMVQGVGFRWFIIRAAEKTGVTGWVRNRYDGSVEIEAEGTRGEVEALIKEAGTGPTFSRVTDVKVEWLKYEAKHKGFIVKY